MCYNGKCMHCLEVETGSLIFAILNIMATSFGSVVSVGGLVYTTFLTQAVINEVQQKEDDDVAAGALVLGLAANVAFALIAVGFCISFSFAVVLIVGLCKKKANLVKCYFVYGVMKTVFGMAVVIGLAINSSDVPDILFLLLIHFFYVLILTMIRMTYKKLETDVAYNSFSNPMSAVQKF